MLVRVAALVAAALTALVSAKITPAVHRHLATKDLVDVAIEFDGVYAALKRANTRSLRVQARHERIQVLQETLAAHAKASQQPALDLLAASSRRESSSPAVSVETLWINNVMYVSGANQKLLDAIAALPSVSRIRLPETATLPRVQFDTAAAKASDTVSAYPGWGVRLVNAPAVWSTGNRGQGVVVGSIDTGVFYQHEAVKSNYRSTYGWFDPANSSSVFPTDENGHGTHTMGSAVGQNGIGVAPGATWIACRGCTSTSCTEARLAGCGQWMLCPTDAQGKNPRCDLAPNVINNSWTGNGAGKPWYQAIVDAWETAGIIPVFAVGNIGPGCGTALSPGDYKNVLAVGAVGIDDVSATFSSQGPTPDDRIKPDLSAPGYKVRSAWMIGTSLYNTISGTSMAAPHVTGAVALYLSKNKGATFATVYNALTSGVDTATLTYNATNCGNVSNSQYPNNNYGYGRLNAQRTMLASATPSTTSPTSSTVAPATSTPAPTTPAPTTAASPTPEPSTTTSAPTTAVAPVQTTTTRSPTSTPTTRQPSPSCGTCTACFRPSTSECLTAFTKQECGFYSSSFGTVWCGITRVIDTPKAFPSRQ